MRSVSIRAMRRLVQVGTILAFLIIPVLNAREMYGLVGNMAAFNAGGVPLADPLAMLQVAMATFSVTTAMLVGAGLVLLLAVILGPVFCSWLCPFGFLSELVHRHTKDTPSSGSNVSFRPFLFKSALVVVGLLAVLTVIPRPVLTQLSMPAWFTRFWQHAITHNDLLWPAIVLIPAVLLIERIANNRLWCRYVCPQSVLISLAGLLLPKRFQVNFIRQACSCRASEQACRATCSLELNPRHMKPAQKAQCTNCGDCIDACKTKGRALHFGVTQDKKTG